MFICLLKCYSANEKTPTSKAEAKHSITNQTLTRGSNGEKKQWQLYEKRLLKTAFKCNGAEKTTAMMT